MAKKDSNHRKENVSDTVREIWYAGLGVLSTVEKEGSRLFQKFVKLGEELVEKGKEFEKEDRQQAISAKLHEATKFVEDTIRAASEKVSRPWSEEIKALNQKIDRLAGRVDQIAKKIDKK